jgi:hypothetical protein
MNARWMSVNEVDVRLSLEKRVPLGPLPKIVQRRCTMYLVQSVTY